MKYVLLIYLQEDAPSEAEREQCYQESAQFAQQLHSKGQYVTSAPLHPVTTATTIRMQEGKPLITDGPFAETREQLGGFFLINAQDLDEAIAIATQLPSARFSTIEIRPVIEIAGLPAQS